MPSVRPDDKELSSVNNSHKVWLCTRSSHGLPSCSSGREQEQLQGCLQEKTVMFLTPTDSRAHIRRA